MSANQSPARNAFSFVHASDLHLELPPHGLGEIPEHLRDSLLECPYRAAERVFDLALSERADFLVLDTTASGLAGLPDAALLDGLVFASQGPAWREVYVAGQPRPIDDAHRRERFQATMAALWR